MPCPPEGGQGKIGPRATGERRKVLETRGDKLDFGYGNGVDGVFKFIDNAEVMAVFFPKFGQSVVIDVRMKEGEPPLVRVLPMARSIADLRSDRGRDRAAAMKARNSGGVMSSYSGAPSGK